MKHSLFAAVIILGMTLAFSLAPSRQSARGADAIPAGAPGLSLSFESSDVKSTDAREVRLISLCVPHGAYPTPFISPGAFHATWHGAITLKLRDEYIFTAHGRGEFELLINGQSILKVAGEDLAAQSSVLTKLKKGPNEIEARYTAPADGDATIRLYWAEKNRPSDPISPIFFTHTPDDSLTAKTQLRAGRELVATDRCLRCHAPDPARTPKDGAMPELAIDAPTLDSAGSQFNAQWMARWISNPRALRASASMPRLFHDPKVADDQVDPRARDIAAYLATRIASAPAAADVAITDEKSAAGAHLFTSLGCIACHTPPAADVDATGKRITLRFIKAKFHPAALVEFIKKPEAHYAWIRMPDFNLSNDEATNLAAFLLSTSPDDATPAVDMSAADAARGKTLFENSGCVNCHAPSEKSGLTTAKSLADLTKTDWTHGCLAADDSQRGDAPNFSLDAGQIDAIRGFAKTDWSSLQHESLPEFAERSIHTLNCSACHTRDAQLDAWSNLTDDIAAVEKPYPPIAAPQTDQTRPVLTWVGDKLHPDWMTKFISGKVDFKPRPWLKSRMPAFASRAAWIAQGLSLEHGWGLTEDPEPAPDVQIVAIGRKLVARNGGFSCNQCHAINQSPAFVPFDSPAPNFMYVTERLRKDYYHRWVGSPQKYQPGTKMPNYADADGKTPYKDILGGDANQQFEAIWQYLRAGQQIVAPE